MSRWAIRRRLPFLLLLLRRLPFLWVAQGLLLRLLPSETTPRAILSPLGVGRAVTGIGSPVATTVTVAVAVAVVARKAADIIIECGETSDSMMYNTNYLYVKFPPAQYKAFVINLQ